MEDVMTTARDVFDRLPAQREDPEFEDWNGSYKFDVDGQGTWTATVHDGKVEIHEGDIHAECVIHCSNEEFMRLFHGEQNLMTAWMQGRLEAYGDLALLQRFHGFLRSGARAGGEADR